MPEVDSKDNKIPCRLVTLTFIVRIVASTANNSAMVPACDLLSQMHRHDKYIKNKFKKNMYKYNFEIEIYFSNCIRPSAGSIKPSKCIFIMK